MPMRDLIIAVRQALQDAAELDYFSESSIVISPHLNLLPAVKKMPAIVIKDGREVRKPKMGNSRKISLHVPVAVYVEVLLDSTGEATMLGRVDHVGILQAAEDVADLLDGNTVGRTEVQNASIFRIGESKVFDVNRKLLSRKVITVNYDVKRRM